MLTIEMAEYEAEVTSDNKEDQEAHRTSPKASGSDDPTPPRRPVDLGERLLHFSAADIEKERHRVDASSVYLKKPAKLLTSLKSPGLTLTSRINISRAKARSVLPTPPRPTRSEEKKKQQSFCFKCVILIMLVVLFEVPCC